MLGTWKSRILELLVAAPGLTDREITDRLAGRNRGQQTVNQMCRQLENEGRLVRRSRHDGLIGNYARTAGQPAQVTTEIAHADRVVAVMAPPQGQRPTERREPSEPVQNITAPINPSASPEAVVADGWLSEDEVKLHLGAWLENLGWKVRMAWGQERGVDVVAEKDAERWLIEAKGGGSRPEMRVNYFLSMLGETLQRMDDPGARYSIALPSMRQFRGLWSRLPALAKARLGITALFVSADGTVEELEAASVSDVAADQAANKHPAQARFLRSEALRRLCGLLALLAQ
jgi:hypothetical protein